MKRKGLSQQQLEMAVRALAGVSDRELGDYIRILVANLRMLSSPRTVLVSLAEHRRISVELEVYIAVLRSRDGRKVPLEAKRLSERALSRRSGGGRGRKKRRSRRLPVVR